uniref:Uncharacterized protein n=1 Tax=Rhizophora mucronata TaxID=61149 RepID=A0A2P2P6A1_RHIMU
MCSAKSHSSFKIYSGAQIAI